METMLRLHFGKKYPAFQGLMGKNMEQKQKNNKWKTYIYLHFCLF